MTEREAFEAHMLGLNACTRLIRQKDGSYWTTSVQRAWNLWQASRKQALQEAEKVARKEIARCGTHLYPGDIEYVATAIRSLTTTPGEAA